MYLSVVNQIKEAMFDKTLKIGDKLPPERELVEQFKTSRVTIREALRALEQFGFLEIKRGMEGGTFIRDPNTKYLNNFLNDMFSLGNIKISHLTEVRLATEPMFVKNASKCTNDLFLKSMAENIKETKEFVKIGNQKDARLCNLEFHRLIARASNNPVYDMIIDFIMDIMENKAASIILARKPVEQTLKYHERIYAAIRTKKHDDAGKIMFEHILDSQEALQSKESKEGNSRKRQSCTKPVLRMNRSMTRKGLA
jgi:DNA-binding FadR family transcriptional regulator